MSEEPGIQLSEPLINDLVAAITKNAPSAQDNIGITLQYMGAVMGYLSAQFPGSDAERHDWLEQLSGFIVHVSDEHAEDIKAAEQDKINVQQPAQQAEPSAPAGKCEADPSNEAAGVWHASK
ncbi:hypothetical protein MNBD_GAMMA22-1186 [hydrothermal vent metagenome]|uniref:Uncharacterized protein n=1 Tax=hydrothermal vent metagenome TaxID=652676 RepID=A0A3B0ZX09_9ZZZZ